MPLLCALMLGIALLCAAWFLAHGEWDLTPPSFETTSVEPDKGIRPTAAYSPHNATRWHSCCRAKYPSWFG